MGHDAYDHTPREGCACDLCIAYQDERHALADAAGDASRDHQEAHCGPAEGASRVCLCCPALVDSGSVLCLECLQGGEEEDSIPSERGWRDTDAAGHLVLGSDAWWDALDSAVAARDRAMVSRLTGAQDPSTGDLVDAFVSMLNDSRHHAAARSEAVTACGRVRS